MATPTRLAPFLAQWDYMRDSLLDRLKGIGDEEYLWSPTREAWTVRAGEDGRTRPDTEAWPITSEPVPPRTLAWSICHLGAGSLVRADWLDGSHSLKDSDVDWPRDAAGGLALLERGLGAWRGALDHMTDTDLDTVGRSAYPDGLDPELPLIEIVWWVNKELLFHAGEIWYVRDLYAASRTQ